jgi:hypothetical protein
MGTLCTFPEAKRLGREVYHSTWGRSSELRKHTTTSSLNLCGVEAEVYLLPFTSLYISLMWGPLSSVILTTFDTHASVHRRLLSRNTNNMQLCNRIYYSKVFLKTQHVSSGTPLIIRSSKLYLQPLVYMPVWWPAVAKAEWEMDGKVGSHNETSFVSPSRCL